jgi:hypothetical protein
MRQDLPDLDRRASEIAKAINAAANARRRGQGKLAWAISVSLSAWRLVG